MGCESDRSTRSYRWTPRFLPEPPEVVLVRPATVAANVQAARRESAGAARPAPLEVRPTAGEQNEGQSHHEHQDRNTPHRAPPFLAFLASVRNAAMNTPALSISTGLRQMLRQFSPISTPVAVWAEAPLGHL